MVTVDLDTVEFRFFRPEAVQVYITGDFTDWRTDKLPMQRSADGHWYLGLQLPPGTFRFRYVADGEWYTDYAAFGVQPGEFGMDSIVRVAETQKTTLRLAA